MRKLFFLIVFCLPSIASSQNNRIGIVYYWSGHQNIYSSLYHLPYGVFSFDDSATMKNKFFYTKNRKNEIESKWTFYNIGLRFDKNVFHNQYFLRSEINYFYYKKKSIGTTPYSFNYLQDINGTVFINSLEISNTLCKPIAVKQYLSLNIGVGISFWTSFNGKSFDQIFYPYPVNTTSTNTEYFNIYKYYPASYFLNAHLLLEAKYLMTKNICFLFSVFDDYNYYWANGYDISITEVFQYDPNKGYVQTGGGWRHLKIKENGFFPDILKFSISIMWQFH